MVQVTEKYKDLLRFAYNCASHSPDTHTNVGAIVYDEFREMEISWAYNRFPKNIAVTSERMLKPTKYDYILHAEELAVLKAKRDCSGLTLICPWAACLRCTRIIIQSGISTVVRHYELMQKSPQKWIDEISRSDLMFAEAGVKIIEYKGEVGNCEHLFDGKTWNP